jgi:hypothetical protein
VLDDQLADPFVIMRAMSTNGDQFVIDAGGNKTAVLLDIDRYSELLEAQEELEAIRAFDEAKASNDEPIPFNEGVKEIDNESDDNN